ncbi:trypco2 family protein [Streptomyces sp. NPDC006624]|uniref:trypco2 family protein n=1 Tax=unclassified Streptomyces TaxID=2593676 RepID=UPI0033B6A7EA
MGDGHLPLTEVLETLRSQLTELTRDTEGKEILFALSEVELELGVEVTRGGGLSGKVRFGVVEGGADGTAGRKATHTVRVRLEARTTPEGGHIMINDMGRGLTPRPLQPPAAPRPQGERPSTAE